MVGMAGAILYIYIYYIYIYIIFLNLPHNDPGNHVLRLHMDMIEVKHSDTASTRW